MMYLRYPSGMMPYRWFPMEQHDGTMVPRLQYYSRDFGIWRSTNERNPEQFAKDRLTNWDLS